MGLISRKLASRLHGDHLALRRLRDEIAGIQNRTDWVPDPVHSAYVCVQNLTSVFAEAISPLPEMKPYCDEVATAQEEYVPGGPPMSPLTDSYFTTWAFFDLRFGPDAETIGTILLDLAEQAGLSPLHTRVSRQFQESRMGIYEHRGVSGSMVQLQELVTDDRFLCIVPAGHLGREGELWFVRLCPPIPGFDYHVAFTTPYILQRTSKTDWIAYLQRTSVVQDAEDARKRSFLRMKFGSHANGWHEFVFQAYAGHEAGAIFLAGLPDRPESLPHADATGKRRCG